MTMIKDDIMEKFIVADYLDKFECKCGECRACCCEGWPVSITYNEYCKLLGLDCSNELRRKIDCCFSIASKPTMEVYAKIAKNYVGDCPMHSSEGQCLLQKEMGAEALPEICNLYPRNFKSGILMEGCCANSCEKVLELLFESTNRLSFYQTNLAIANVKVIKPEISEYCKNIQKNTIEILQDRQISLNERIIALGEYLKSFDRGTVPSLTHNILLGLSLKLEEFSPNFERYSVEARKNYGIENNCDNFALEIEKHYQEYFDHFEEVLPSWEIYLEKLLINHLFFIRFPYSFSGEALWEEYMALIGIFSLTKYIAVGFMADKTKLEDFIDCIVGLYRCFEHSNANIIIEKCLAAEYVDKEI